MNFHVKKTYVLCVVFPYIFLLFFCAYRLLMHTYRIHLNIQHYTLSLKDCGHNAVFYFFSIVWHTKKKSYSQGVHFFFSFPWVMVFLKRRVSVRTNKSTNGKIVFILQNAMKCKRIPHLLRKAVFLFSIPFPFTVYSVCHVALLQKGWGCAIRWIQLYKVWIQFE